MCNFHRSLQKMFKVFKRFEGNGLKVADSPECSSFQECVLIPRSDLHGAFTTSVKAWMVSVFILWSCSTWATELNVSIF